MTLHRPFAWIAALSTILLACPAAGAESCAKATDRACVIARILEDSGSITDASWRDQTLRDTAASLTYDGRIDDAVALVGKITNPDTQAMTIRAIGMAAALYGHMDAPALRVMFGKLAKAATAITQPDAQAIATTYIAMSQAFAGLDADAHATAAAMTNAALRHKAYGETAEIQAERGDLPAAMASIAEIDAASYRNKAYANVADILIKKDRFDDALTAAQAIDNPAKRAQTLLAILKAQEEKTRGPRKDAAPTDQAARP